MIKLIVTCDIRAGKENEFLEFINHDFAEIMPTIGFAAFGSMVCALEQRPSRGTLQSGR